MDIPVQSDEEQAFSYLNAAFHSALSLQYKSRPDLHGKMFRPRLDGAARECLPMSFSMTLLAHAGGLWQLQREWEVWEMNSRTGCP